MPRESWRQLGFDLTPEPHFSRENFLVSDANQTAFRMIDSWPFWPDNVLLLLGPPGTGKSHLAALWAERSAAEILSAPMLSGTDPAALAGKPALVIEGADEIGAAEATLFHVLNLVRQQRSSLLLTARSKPDLWGLATADLLSRLRLAPFVELGPPDDALLRSVLRKLFLDRQLLVDESVVDFIALHIDRSLDMARYFVDLLDRAALERSRPITRALVREFLPDVTDEEGES